MAGGLTRDERRDAPARSIVLDRCIDVYSADTSRGWRIVRKVSVAYAYDKVIEGKWAEVFDDIGNFYGCKILAVVKTDQELPSGEPAPVSITPEEMQTYAGLDGRSATLGRNEEYRINHANLKTKRPEPEDRIERVIVKVQQWPFPASRIDNGRGIPVFGDRAIRCYPRP